MSFLSFSGRATRSEYWSYAWIPFLVVPSVGVIIYVPVVLPFFDRWPLEAFASLFCVATLVQLVASPLWLGITVSRLHDTGRFAWQLLPYAVIVLGWVLFVEEAVGDDPSVLLGWYGVIWVLVSWAFVIRLLVICSRLGTVGSNQYGTQPGVVEESGWGDAELTLAECLGTKQRTTGFNSVLRFFGALGFGLLAVASAMILLVGFTLSALFVLSLMSSYSIERSGPANEDEYPYQPEAPPRWTPDGSQIVFDDPGKVYSVDANGTSLRLIHGGEGEEDLYYSPAVSPDGSRIAYLKNHRRWPWQNRHLEIAISALDGTDERVLTDLDYVRSMGNPSWSPDGSRIAFAGGGKIKTIAADGSDLQVGDDYYGIAGYGNLVWSPDGQRLRFGAYPRYGLSGNSVVTKVDNSGLQLLPALEGDGAPRFGSSTYGFTSLSPDGSRVAVQLLSRSVGGAYTVMLYTVLRDGSDARALVQRDIDRNLSAAGGGPAVG